VNLHELVSQSLLDTQGSLAKFRPELVLCATIVAMLLVRMSPLRQFVSSFAVVLVGALIALSQTGPWLDVPRTELFTGMLVYDGFTVFIRTVLLLFLLLFVVFTKLSGLPDRDDAADIFTLVIGATLGMCVMASSNHLLTVFLGVEMASVPSYALAAMMKGRRVSSEAALKYAVYGAGSAGVMLYGISLLGGTANSLHLPTIAIELAEKLPSMTGDQITILALGGLMIGVGLAFKLSAVPFHFWCPDVFEGAAAEIGAFLSIASKAGALALLLRVAIGVSCVAPGAGLPEAGPAAAEKTAAEQTSAAAATESSGELVMTLAVAEGGEVTKAETQTTAAPLDRQTAMQNLAPVRSFIGKLVALLAALSCTFGNLAAYGQTNIKRLFAYSTIAHAGYMMMGVAAVMVVAGYDPAAASQAAGGIAIYIFTYLFMNLGAFSIIAFWRNSLRTEEIADYAGLLKQFPGSVICFAAVLFSLIGLPPLAGFIGKFAVFASMANGYKISATAGEPAFYLLLLLVIGSINTAISLFYYLRLIKTMTIDPEPKDRRPVTESQGILRGIYLGLITLPLLTLILSWNWLTEWAVSAASRLLG
jgi:NADH-quinone oxidoreductase subunit N